MKETLRTLFQQKFNPIEYRKVVLQNLLHAQQLLSQPQFLEETNDGDRIYGLGYLTDADGKQIGLYYTDVVNSDVRRKRVGFRQMMKKYTDFGVDAAIAVFADKEHWRLSYMSDLKGGETSAKRFSYILGDLNGQYNTPVNRLLQLGTQAPRLRLKDIFEAFSVETLSDEFFDLYRDHYADIVEYLTGKRMVKVDSKWVEKVIHAPLQSVYEQLTGVENADKIVRDYVKKMMGRIVFLHFLQKKGWLNDDTNFMQHTFLRNKDCQDDFLEKILEPLFFGFLNTRKEDRAKLFDKHPNWDKQLLTVWENIPYLNGGLFEQDEVDNLNIRLPRSMFDDLFTFLAEYNFTVDENDPDDPEMLGKIFESLLEDNKAKGAFYTPKEIVRYMCKESLIAYLSSRISESPCPAGRDLVDLINSSDSVGNDNRVSLTANGGNNLQDSQDFASETSRSIRRFVEHHEMQPELEPYREVLDTALRNVKICDPAIGSGAFPMGLLNELWRCREALMDAADTSERCDFSNTVQAVLNGVATEWEQRPKLRSAVTSTEKPLRAEGTRPQTRAALKREIIENNIYGVDIEKGAIDIARLRFWLSIVVDAEEPEPLPNFDYKFMQGNSLIESYKGIDLSRISNRLRGGQSKSTQLLLGLDSDFSKKNLQRLMRDYFSVTDHKQKSSMRQAINDEVKHLISDFIGGTAADLDKLDPSANQDFFLWHTWFKDIFDNGGFDIVIGNPPYISAVEMVRSENEKALYKKTYPQATGAYDIYILFLLRGLMLSKNVFFWIIPNKFLIADYAKKTKELLELKGLYSSIDVSIFNVFKNASVYPIIVCGSKSNNKGFCKYTLDYYEDLLLNKVQPVREIETTLTVRDCGITVCSGATGFEAQKIKEYVVDGESDNVIPFTVSGNIDRYTFNNRDVRYMKSKYRNAYIRLNCDVASSKLNMWMSPKIVIAGMTKVIESTYVETPLAIGVGVYAITSFGKYSPYYITGLLNSKYTSYYLRNKFKDKHLAGGYLAINKSTIEQLPFINADAQTQDFISSKVKEILLLEKTKPYADTSSLEHEIDKLVYQLYNLTPEEIAIIEKNAQ